MTISRNLLSRSRCSPECVPLFGGKSFERDCGPWGRSMLRHSSCQARSETRPSALAPPHQCHSRDNRSRFAHTQAATAFLRRASCRTGTKNRIGARHPLYLRVRLRCSDPSLIFVEQIAPHRNSSIVHVATFLADQTDFRRSTQTQRGRVSEEFPEIGLRDTQSVSGKTHTENCPLCPETKNLPLPKIRQFSDSDGRLFSPRPKFL